MNNQAAKIGDQVIGKIHWSATRDEVRDWLQHTHNLPPAEADALIEQGFKARRAEIRQRALIRLIIAAVGLALFAGFLCAQYFGGFVVVGVPVLIVWGLGLGTVAVILRSLKELVSGDSDRSM